MNKKGHVLISPLDWGLGHATRSTVIAEWLLEEGFKVSVAGDQVSLEIFQESLGSRVSFVEGMPAYQVKYHPKGLMVSLLQQAAQIWSVARKENKWIREVAPKLGLTGLISDNRFGLFHPEIYSVYLSHQINIRAYGFESLAKLIHRRVIQKFDACWIPDYPGKDSLSGSLSRGYEGFESFEYIGWLNRLEKFNEVDSQERYKAVVLGSGPEPARGLFLEKMAKILEEIEGDHLLLEGKPGQTKRRKEGNLSWISHLGGEELKSKLKAAEFIITRPGYTSLMELAEMNKSLILVPTPGQTEQMYLGKRLDQQGRARQISERKLNAISLKAAMQGKYSFYQSHPPKVDLEKLFKPFLG